MDARPSNDRVTVARPALRAAAANGSIRQRVQAALTAMIREGRLRPGERLLEVRVADAFHISRSPARATLEAMCRERLLTKADGRGYRVAGPAEPDADGRPGRLGRLARLEPVAIAPAPRGAHVDA
ncbi:MAG: GntR family transcriptional regulator, partial [Lautropia sp.]